MSLPSLSVSEWHIYLFHSWKVLHPNTSLVSRFITTGVAHSFTLSQHAQILLVVIQADLYLNISLLKVIWSELSSPACCRRKVVFPMNGALVFSQTPRYVREDQWAPPPCLHAWQAHTKCLRPNSLIQHHILTVAHTCTLGMLWFIYHCPPWQY